MSPWVIYLWGIVDSIFAGMVVATILSAGTAIFFFVCSYVPPQRQVCESDTSLKKREEEWQKDPDRSAWQKRAHRFATLFAVLFVMAVLIPSSKTVALMVIIPAVLDSQPIQKDLPEIYEMAKEALKQTLQTK